MRSEKGFIWREELEKMEVGWEERGKVLIRRKHMYRKDHGRLI